MPSPQKNLSLFPEGPFLSPHDFFHYEESARKAGYSLVAGVDEAGRGPLAGPVVASAVILPHDVDLTGITDSKKMTEKARNEAFSVIQRRAISTGIGVVSHQYIDRFNILKASLEAMRRAIAALDPHPEFLLVDGIHRVPTPLPQQCVKKGDLLSLSISSASVLAKVYRDRIMLSYHERYPVYGFDRNKGYGTRRHLQALRKYGECPLHRVTFKGVLSLDQRKT